MVIKTTRDETDADELSKTINKRTTEDIRKDIMKTIQETKKKGTLMKIARTLGIGSK